MNTKTIEARTQHSWIGAGREAARRLATYLIEQDEPDYPARDEMLAAAGRIKARREVQEWLAANAPETLEAVDEAVLDAFLEGFITECRENLP